MSYEGTDFFTKAPHPLGEQTYSLVVDGSGGNFKCVVQVPGHAVFTTADIAFNATAAAVRTAINTALGDIGMSCTTADGGVGAAGGGTPYVLTFDQIVKLTTTDTLTGGAGTAVATETLQGPPRQIGNGSELELPINVLPTKIPSNTTRTAYDRQYEDET